MKTLLKSEKKLVLCKERVDQLETCFKITSLLNSHLDLENLLDMIMKTAKEVMKADASSLLLIDVESNELVFQIALSDIGKQIKKLGGKQSLKMGQGIAGNVAKTGRPMIIKDAYKHPKFNPEYDKRTGFKTGSILCSPMKVKEEIIGVCQVIHHRDKGKVFTGKELSLFMKFCESAALAVQNARSHQALMEMQRMEKDMEFALSVQKSFLPKDVPRHNEFVFAAKTTPARIVGGDFYDFIPFSENLLGMVVGDVSGKGVSAALQMARLMSDFRYVSQIDPEPARVLQEVNNILCRRSQGGMFTTAIYLLLDMKQKNIRIANGGHPALLLRNNAKQVLSKGKAGGPPLGILPHASYPQEKILLKSGERMVVYTDGVTEPKNKNNLFYGIEKLSNILKSDENSLEDFIIKLEKSIHQFVGNELQFDDLTVLTFQVL